VRTDGHAATGAAGVAAAGDDVRLFMLANWVAFVSGAIPRFF
jgi:hypothetical protein